jgi:hypothetical protein
MRTFVLGPLIALFILWKSAQLIEALAVFLPKIMSAAERVYISLASGSRLSWGILICVVVFISFVTFVIHESDKQTKQQK